MMNSRFFIELVFLSLMVVGLGGCARIVIQHQDPGHEVASVQIDGKDEGEIAFGDEDSYFVGRGVHQVMITPENGDKCVWTKDGKGWEIGVDEGAMLVLLPQVSSASNTDIDSAEN